MQLDFEPTARQVYDSFLISYPEVVVEGLFVKDAGYYVVSPAAEDMLADGITRAASFARKSRPAGAPIDLVRCAPPGAMALTPRTGPEVADAFGASLSSNDLIREVSTRVPATVPLDSVALEGAKLVLLVSRTLDAKEHAAAISAVMTTGQPLEIEVRVAPGSTGSTSHRAGTGSLGLIPSRQWRQLSSPVRTFLEDDEEFWRSQFRDVWSGRVGADHVFGEGRKPAKNGCLVGTMVPPSNVRTYLSLYDHVVLVMPLAGDVEKVLDGLAVSRRDLVELVSRGYVSFIVPQSIERYDPDFLRELLEARPSAVLGSRRLAAATHVDQMARNPLFVFPGTALDRRVVLRALLRLAATNAEMGSVVAAVAAGLADSWSGYERALHALGAMASLTGPLTSVGQQLAKVHTGNDYFIELGAAALNVEWASALGAHFAPFESDEFSEVGHAQFLIALHSGIPRDQVPLATPTAFAVAEDLLVIDSKVDVMDFVTTFGEGDLAKFRTAVRGIARPGRGEDEIDEVVRNWNGQVRKYERTPERVKSMGIGGLALGALAKFGGAPDLVSLSASLAPFLPALLTYTQESLVGERREVGSLLDYVNAQLAGVHHDAVFLARMRKLVKGMK